MSTSTEPSGRSPHEGESSFAAGAASVLRRLQLLQVALIQVDGDRRIRAWEGAAEQVFGFSAEEAIGFRPEELPIASPEVAKRLGKILLGVPEVPLEHDLHLLRRDGSTFPARLRATLDFDAAGALAGSCALILDSSAVRRPGETLPTVESLSPVAGLGTLAIGGIAREDLVDRAVRIVADSLAIDLVGVFRLDAERGVLELEGSHGWEEPVQVPITSPDMTQILRPGRAVVNAGEDNFALPAGGVLERVGAKAGLSVPIGDPHRPTGALVALSCSTRAFSPHEVEFLQATSHVLSAAGERERSRELESRFQRLSRIEAMGQLTGGIAHDFNNLLAVILNYTSFAREEAAGDRGGVLRSLSEIETAARRAAELTHQLLVFSRQEVVAVEPIDVADAVAAAESMLGRTLGEQIELETRLEPGLRPIEAGPGQIEQIIVNLAVNARDALTEGGVVRVTVERAGRDDDDYRWIRIAVADDGAGMARDVLEKAFEPFFTTKPVGEGSGLGLATVYGIVSGLGGSIEIGSEPGSGTEVDILLPVAAAEPATQAELPVPASAPDQQIPAAEPEAEADENPRTVLLVEDDPMVRRLTTRVLSEGGFEVLAADGGEQAMALVDSPATASIDVLLTDVVMPGLSGVELAQKICALVPGVRVVFMSGYTGDSISRDAVREFEAGFVEKPFTPESLLESLGQALDQA